jgi:hypothetical protein
VEGRSVVDKVVIYTAIFGPKDDLQDPNISTEHEMVCFTDQDFSSNNWRIVKSKPRCKDTRADAKWFKMNPHTLFPGRRTVWVDGNYKMFGDPALVFAKEEFKNAAFFRHDERSCLYDEVLTCLERDAGNPDDLKRQAEFYASQGMPKGFGLFQGNVIFREDNSQTRQLNEKWATQLEKFSSRDQISLPYVLWSAKIPVLLMHHSNKRKFFMKSGRHRFHGTREYQYGI